MPYDINNLTTIDNIIRGGKYSDNRDLVSGLLSDPASKHYLLSKMPKKFANLQDIDFILESLVNDDRRYFLFTFLEQSMLGNELYITDFISRHHDEFKAKPDDLIMRSGLDILEKIAGNIGDPHIADALLAFVSEHTDNERDEKYNHRMVERTEEYISRIIFILYEYYERLNRKDKMGEIIQLIGDKLSLTERRDMFIRNTTAGVFKVLVKYIESDFENNFKQVKDMIVAQLRIDQDNKFEGWEWWGGGISMSGSSYRISDRPYVDELFREVLRRRYDTKPEDAWLFILKYCLSKTNEVNADKPDFLNRAALPIVLNRYKTGSEEVSKEALNILEEFILSNKGIPHKSDLVFYSVANDSSCSIDKKWALIKPTVDKYKYPINTFAEQMVVNLAISGHSEAKELIKQWANSEEYYKHILFDNSFILSSISLLLDSDPEFALKLFSDFIDKPYFKEQFDHFHVFDIAHILNAILTKRYSDGLSIINKLSSLPTLTKNQQTLLMWSLLPIKREDEKTEAIVSLYNDFVKPFLNRHNDNASIRAIITDSNAREVFLQFAERLAEHPEIENRIEKALGIVDLFTDDPDPVEQEGETSEHRRIANGQEEVSITSVRGWCSWVLSHCTVIDGRKYIPKIIDLTERLAFPEDGNYYVMHMACHSLAQLAHARLSTMPPSPGETTKYLFFDINDSDIDAGLALAKRVDDIAFRLMDTINHLPEKPKNVLARSLLMVLGKIRALNATQAKQVMDFYAGCSGEAQSSAGPLFIYFAEFRKDDFKNWPWQSEQYYNDLSDFDDAPFKDMLEDLLRSGEDATRSTLAHQMLILADDKKTYDSEGADLFTIALKYMNVLATKYELHTFETIYWFVKEQMNNHFNECYELWCKAMATDTKTLNEYYKESKSNSVPNWTSNYHEEILIMIKDKRSVEAFLDAFLLLLEYPVIVYLGNIDAAVKVVKECGPSNAKAKEIMNKLAKREPVTYFEVTNKWLGDVV